MSTKKVLRRQRVKKSIRGKISGSAEKPRLAVYRSNKEIYAQIVNDVDGVTLAFYSSQKLGKKEGNKTDQSKSVGTEIAKIAQDKGISTVVFDRGVSLYHGRIKALADGAREGGLKF